MPAPGWLSIHYRVPESSNILEIVIETIRCVFVHGWAMNAAVWEACKPLLPPWMDAEFIDLPGHGERHDELFSTLDEMVDHVAARASQPAVWIGWSLGGLVCQRLAERYPERVRALYLLASTPRFVRCEDWPTAVEQSVFDDFSRLFTRDIDKTIKRFIALQLMGSEDPRSVMQSLQSAMDERGLPHPDALSAGLDVLQHADTRSALHQLECPLGAFMGEQDMLIPASVREPLLAMRPDIDIEIQQAAGHAPFISHPQRFTDALARFIESRVLQA